MDATRRKFLHSLSAAALTGAAGINTETLAVAARGARDRPAPACPPGETEAARRGNSKSVGQGAVVETSDPLGVRPDFPVVGEGIYLDSPYIAPSPIPVVQAGQDFLSAKLRDPVPLGEMLAETDRVRRRFAEMIGAKEAEIGILDSTSAGENLVANSLDLGTGDNIVIDDLHYETTFVLYRHLEATRGVELRILESEDGAATPEEFASLVDDSTRLVSVSWVSHQNGYRHDLTALADLAHTHGAYLYAVAIQGISMISLNVQETDGDLLTS